MLAALTEQARRRLSLRRWSHSPVGAPSRVDGPRRSGRMPSTSRANSTDTDGRRSRRAKVISAHTTRPPPLLTVRYVLPDFRTDVSS